MSMFARGAKLIADRQAEHCSLAAIYVRGTQRISLPVVQGANSALVATDEAEVRMSTSMQTFIIRTSDLVLNGQRIEPRVGDSILVDRGGVEVRYDVMAEGEQAWRYVTAERQQIRVFTQITQNRRFE